MKYSGTSESYQKGNLKAMVHLAEHIRRSKNQSNK
jgi:hypothetical protein